jgi:hypothetical protein
MLFDSEPQALIATAAAHARTALAAIFPTRLMRAQMIRIMTPAMAARLLAALLLATAIAGCGQTSATYRSGWLRLRVGEYVITPEAVRMPGGPVRLRVTNDGVLVHEVAVANGDGHIVGQTGAIFPGRTVTTKPFVLTPGSYRVYDPGANYADLGAYGSLRVVG